MYVYTETNQKIFCEKVDRMNVPVMLLFDSFREQQQPIDPAEFIL